MDLLLILAFGKMAFPAARDHLYDYLSPQSVVTCDFHAVALVQFEIMRKFAGRRALSAM